MVYGRSLVWLSTLFLSHMASANLYSVTRIASGQGFANAYGLSPTGVVVGRNGGLDPFTWSTTEGYQIHSRFPNSSVSQFYGMNSHGVATGGGQLTSRSVGFTWTQQGGYRALGALGGSQATFGYDINESGQVVGAASDSSNRIRATLWSSQNVASGYAGVPGWTLSYALRMNDSGDATGFSDGTDHGDQAVLWRPGQAARLLGALPGHSSSLGNDINSSRVVVGSSFGGRALRGFYWTEATGMAEVSPLFGTSEAFLVGVNDAGLAVGESGTGANKRTLLYSPTMGGVDLNGLLDDSGDGWILESAVAINNQGDILGYGQYDGRREAFFARVVPEPSMVATLSLALLLARRVGTSRRKPARLQKR